MKDWWDLTYEDTDEDTNVTKQESYSVGLKLAVAALLDANPEERLTSEEIYHWLKPYKENIVELSSFEGGLPVVKNMQKYQPYLLKYEKKGKEIPIYQNVVSQQQNVVFGNLNSKPPVQQA